MTDVVTANLQIDLKRRTTLPGDILTAAGIPPGSTLVARVEESGRIVLESPRLLLTLLQDEIAAAMDADPGGDVEPGMSLVDELFVDRAADVSLEDHALQNEEDDEPVVPISRGPVGQEGRA